MRLDGRTRQARRHAVTAVRDGRRQGCGGSDRGSPSGRCCQHLPAFREALAAVTRAGIPQFHLGSNRSGALAALNQIGRRSAGGPSDRARPSASSPSSTAMPRTCELGDYWLNAIRRAAAERQLPDVTVETVATDGTDAADGGAGIGARRASPPSARTPVQPPSYYCTAAARQDCAVPSDLAGHRHRSRPIGHVSDPPVDFDRIRRRHDARHPLGDIMGASAVPLRRRSGHQPVARLVQRNST